MWPPPAPPAPPVPKEEEKKEVKEPEIDYKAPYIQGAKQVGALSATVLAMGACAPNPAFSSMLTTFALSNIIGVQVVLGVTHSLHSPLMAVTNAISGTTALGGIHLLAHSNKPSVSFLGAAATTLSTVNIVGASLRSTLSLARYSFTDPTIVLTFFGIFLNCRRFYCNPKNVGHV